MTRDELMDLNPEHFRAAIQSILAAPVAPPGPGEREVVVPSTGEPIIESEPEPGTPAHLLAQFAVDRFYRRSEQFNVRTAISSVSGLTFRLGAAYARIGQERAVDLLHQAGAALLLGKESRAHELIWEALRALAGEEIADRRNPGPPPTALPGPTAWVGPSYRCSDCGGAFITDAPNGPPVACPHCGARFVGEPLASAR